MTCVVPLELSVSFPAGISVMITVVSGSFDEVISPLAIVFCWLAAGISTAAAAVSTAEISTAETSVPIVSVADISTGETSVPRVSTGDISTGETSVPTVSVADISTVSTGDFSTVVTSGTAVSTGGVWTAGCSLAEVSATVSAFGGSGVGVSAATPTSGKFKLLMASTKRVLAEIG